MRKLTIQEMKEIAESRGGTCLSDTYNGGKLHLKWQCSRNHVWEARPDNIKSGKWCPYCARNVKLTIEEMQKLAESRGGKCLSAEYKGFFVKLRWQCSKGHIWDAIPSNVKQHGKWCPHCNRNARFTLEDAQNIARQRGGICLSTKYKNMHTKMEWKCAKGHVWKARLHDIKDDHTWCPVCHTYASEKICREIFEIFFQSEFKRIRPNWLKSSRGFNLELDGYNEKLKLAFEFHGQQHYTHIELWHKKRTLDMQKKRDEEKRQLCTTNGITLIEIPYTVSHEKLGSFIYEQCLAKGFRPLISKIPDYKTFDVYSELPIIKTGKERYLARKLKNPEKFKQEKRESDQRYLAKHRERLKAYHKEKYWKRRNQIIAEKLLRNEKVVLRSKDFHLNQIKQVAESRGGKCLSNSFVNAKTKMEFECKEGHRWFSAPHHVKDGSWCPECYNIKRIDRLRNNRKYLTIGLQRTKPATKHSYEPSEPIVALYCMPSYGLEGN